MTMKRTKFKLCLSTTVEADSPTLPDEEALRRLQGAFTMDEGRRYSLHAEVIAYHLQQLLRWATAKNPRRPPGIGIDASTSDVDMLMSVDCFLKTDETKEAP